MRITVGSAAPFTFEWSNAYNGVVGAATTDLDINFIDPFTGQIVETGNEANLATTTPLEMVGVPAGVYDVEISVADRADKSKLPTMLKFSANNSDLGIVEPEFKIKGANTSGIGHSSGLDTISVGAVPWYEAPPFNNNQPIESEDFSSS